MVQSYVIRRDRNSRWAERARGRIQLIPVSELGLSSKVGLLLVPSNEGEFHWNYINLVNVC